MKNIILLILFTCTFTTIYSQTYMKIVQGTGTILSEGNTVDEISFTTTFNCGDAILYGGETYPTVQIGTQCWFAKNLNIGTMILGSANPSDNGIIEKYCYNNLPANCITYGGLYQWEETMQYLHVEQAQGICPNGWHVPSWVEFETLVGIVGGGDNGNTLKVVGQGTESGAGTNTSGFSAIIAGMRNYDTNFSYLGEITCFWSSTDYGTFSAHGLGLDNVSNSIFGYGPSIETGANVRCLKD